MWHRVLYRTAAHLLLPCDLAPARAHLFERGFSIHDSISSVMKPTTSFASYTAETILALQARLDNFVKHLSSVPDLPPRGGKFAMWTKKGRSTIFVMMRLLYHSTSCIVGWSTYPLSLFLFAAKSMVPLSVIVDPFLEVPMEVAVPILGS
jgi:hypothetical protein